MERLKEGWKQWREVVARMEGHSRYISCMYFSVCIHVYVWIYDIVKICTFISVWHARVKCVGDCDDFALCCPTLLCGQVCGCVFFVLLWIFCQCSPAFCFFPASPPFPAASKALFVSSVANHSSSLQTWATSYKCHLVWLRHRGSQCRRPLTLVCLICIQNKENQEGWQQLSFLVFLWLNRV